MASKKKTHEEGFHEILREIKLHVRESRSNCVLQSLWSMHSHLGDSLTTTKLERLVQECDGLEKSFFGLLNHLNCMKASDVLETYKELVDEIVNFERSTREKINILLSSKFEVCADGSDITLLNIYNSDFEKDVCERHEMIKSQRPSAIFDSDRVKDIDHIIRKSEHLFFLSNQLSSIESLSVTNSPDTGTAAFRKNKGFDSSAITNSDQLPCISTKNMSTGDEEIKTKNLSAAGEFCTSKSPETSTSRNKLQPSDLLFCLHSSFSEMGLPVRTLEYKERMYERYQAAHEVDNENCPDIIDQSIEGIEYRASRRALDKLIAQKSASPEAMDVVAGILTDIKKSLDNFEFCWTKTKSNEEEGDNQNSVDLTSMQAELPGVAATDSLKTMSPEAKIIANPFGSETINNMHWNWLLSLPTYANSVSKVVEFIESAEDGNKTICGSDLNALGASVIHPFINPRSILYKKASMIHCIPPYLSDILQSENSALCGSKLSENHRGTSNCTEDTTLFTALQPFNGVGPFDIELKRYKLYADHIRSIKINQHFSLCVERAVALLCLGVNVIVVDRATRSVIAAENECQQSALTLNETSSSNLVPDNFHRATMLLRIILCSRQKCTSSQTEENERQQRSRGSTLSESVLSSSSSVGPILIVCRAVDLLDICDTFQLNNSKNGNTNNDMRILSYHGNSDDRRILQSFLIPEFMYNEEPHALVVIADYESFVSDLYCFKRICWWMIFLDSPWGIVSNKKYQRISQAMQSVDCRHRILSSFSLVQQDSSTPQQQCVYPDLSLSLSILMPTVWSELQNKAYPLTKFAQGKCVMNRLDKRLCIHLLAALTVCYEESMAELSNEREVKTTSSQADDVSVWRLLSDWMSLFIWDGVSLAVDASCLDDKKSQNKSRISYSYNFNATYTNLYSDPFLERELSKVHKNKIVSSDSSKHSMRRLAVTSSSARKGRDRQLKCRGIAGVGVVRVKRGFNAPKHETSMSGSSNEIMQQIGQKRSQSLTEEVIEDDMLSKGVCSDQNDDGGIAKLAERHVHQDQSPFGFLDSDAHALHPSVSVKELKNDEVEETKLVVDEDISPSVQSTVNNELLSAPQTVSRGNESSQSPKKRKLELKSDKAASLSPFEGMVRCDMIDPAEYKPLKLKVVAIRTYGYKEELERSLYTRGHRVQVVLNFPGRQRYLGTFKTLQEAEQAFRVALTQRSILLSSVIYYVLSFRCSFINISQGISGLTRLRIVGVNKAEKFHPSLLLQQTGIARKAEESRLVRESDLVSKVHESVLTAAIKDMLQPLLSIKDKPLALWESDICPVGLSQGPRAYAKLQGPGGFGEYMLGFVTILVFIADLVAYVTTRSECILGRFFTETIKLAQSLGIVDPIGIGLNGLHDDEAFDRVDIHLGDDSSIARQHASIRYNEKESLFEICALHKSATVYLQGQRIYCHDGYVPIPRGGAIQLGFRIFWFLYPKQKSAAVPGDMAEDMWHPLVYKKKMFDVMLTTLLLRQYGFSGEGHASTAAASFYSKAPIAADDQSNIQDIFECHRRNVDEALNYGFVSNNRNTEQHITVVDSNRNANKATESSPTKIRESGSIANAPIESIGIYKPNTKNKQKLQRMSRKASTEKCQSLSAVQTELLETGTEKDNQDTLERKKYENNL